MARGIFIGLTAAEILAIRTAAVESLTSGKIKTSWSVDGVSASYAIPAGMSPTEIIEECTYATNYLNRGPGRRVLSDFRGGC
jgi:hypothetical protein